MKKSELTGTKLLVSFAAYSTCSSICIPLILNNNLYIGILSYVIINYILFRFLLYKELLNGNVKLYRLSKNTIFQSLLIIVGSLLLMLNIFNLIEKLFAFDRASIIDLLFLNNNRFSFNIFLIIMGAFIAPVMEEIIFRGLLFEYLKGKLGLYISIFLTTFIFVILHSNKIYLEVFFLSLILTLIYAYYKNIVINIVLHILNNLVSIIIMVKGNNPFVINNIALQFVFLLIFFAIIYKLLKGIRSDSCKNKSKINFFVYLIIFLPYIIISLLEKYTFLISFNNFYPIIIVYIIALIFSFYYYKKFKYIIILAAIFAIFTIMPFINNIKFNTLGTYVGKNFIKISKAGKNNLVLDSDTQMGIFKYEKTFKLQKNIRLNDEILGVTCKEDKVYVNTEDDEEKRFQVADLELIIDGNYIENKVYKNFIHKKRNRIISRIGDQKYELEIKDYKWKKDSVYFSENYKNFSVCIRNKDESICRFYDNKMALLGQISGKIMPYLSEGGKLFYLVKSNAIYIYNIKGEMIKKIDIPNLDLTKKEFPRGISDKNIIYFWDETEHLFIVKNDIIKRFSIKGEKVFYPNLFLDRYIIFHNRKGQRVIVDFYKEKIYKKFCLAWKVDPMSLNEKEFLIFNYAFSPIYVLQIGAISN